MFAMEMSSMNESMSNRFRDIFRGLLIAH